jgi:hypothetical protein
VIGNSQEQDLLTADAELGRWRKQREGNGAS